MCGIVSTFTVGFGSDSGMGGGSGGAIGIGFGRSGGAGGGAFTLGGMQIVRVSGCEGFGGSLGLRGREKSTLRMKMKTRAGTTMLTSVAITSDSLDVFADFSEEYDRRTGGRLELEPVDGEPLFIPV